MKRWMRIVGGFYLLLGVLNAPPLFVNRLGMQYPFLELAADHPAVMAIVDLWFVFGVESAVLGVMLLIAAAQPRRNVILVQLVLLLELSRIAMDLFWISRGYYDAAPYAGWIVIHLLIIVSGRRLLQQPERVRPQMADV